MHALLMQYVQWPLNGENRDAREHLIRRLTLLQKSRFVLDLAFRLQRAHANFHFILSTLSWFDHGGIMNYAGIPYWT